MNDRIPEYMTEALFNYLYFGTRPGSFLYAILCNDFYAACRTADTNNQKALFAWGMVVERLPRSSWGPQKCVDRWTNDRRKDPTPKNLSFSLPAYLKPAQEKYVKRHAKIFLQKPQEDHAT